MAVGRVESATQTATADHLLGSGSTVAGVYTCSWNLTDMVNGDVVECYVQNKTLTGDTIEKAYSGWYQHANGGGDPIVTSPPVVSFFAVRCGVRATAGSISVPWALDRIAEY